MNTRDNIKLISKLNRETKEDIIKWEVSNTRINSLIGSEIIIGSIYMVTVLNKNIRLYKYKEKHFYDEDVFNWLEGYRLEFIDNIGNSQFTFPHDRAVYDLYETVQYKTSEVEDFLSNYLLDDE